MTDGTFKYNLTLPRPEDLTAQVSYIEKSANEIKNQTITEEEIKSADETKISQETDQVKVTELDHFTIFIVTGGKDKTSSPTHVFNISDFGQLSASDDNSYQTDGQWPRSAYDESQYLQFNFNPEIPSGTIINKAEVVFEYKRQKRALISPHYGAKLKVCNHSCNNVNNWYDLATDLRVPKDNNNNYDLDDSPSDETFFVDIPNEYINTPDKVNNLTVRFLTYGSRPGLLSGIKTYHDYVTLNIDYIQAPVCGNGIKDGSEECDGADLGGLSPSDFTCKTNCTLDLVEPKVDICHATSSNSNPYILEHPNKSADVSGHDGHNGPIWYPGINRSWGDIIPPFSYIGGLYPGKNWTTEGQLIWDNGCEIPVVAPKLTITKIVVNDNGGNAVASSVPLYLDDILVTSGISNTTTVGTHTISEPYQGGYQSTISGDCAADGTITLAAGDIKSCTITNNDIAPKLNLRKIVVGGNAADTDWVLTADGDGANDFSGTTPVNSDASLQAGTFNLSETGPDGYSASTWSCTDPGLGGRLINDSSIYLNIGGESTCTITNTIKTAPLHINKFEDKNGDGDEDTGEGPLGGWTMEAYTNNTCAGVPVANATTDTDGVATINNLFVGETYWVKETLAAGWQNTTGNCRSQSIVDSQINNRIGFGNRRTPVTIKASKIVCNSEADLPNWGVGGNGAPGTILETTAQDYVNTHSDNCWLESGWNFQWGYEGEVIKPNDGGVIGPAVGWNNFNSLSAGSIPAELTIGQLTTGKNIYVRENLQSGYVPYSYPPDISPGSEISAEIYCHNDVSKYDNYDRIDNPQYGQTYYCVAFNTLSKGRLEIKKFEDVNANGLKDSSETYLPNWNMTIYTTTPGNYCLQGTEIETKPTDENGIAAFDLLPGTYDVWETGLTDGTHNGWENTTGNPCKQVTIINDQTTTLEYGNFQKTSISGLKWEDVDGDSTMDAGESGIGDWKITIYYYKDGIYNYLTETLTATDGTYSFNDLGIGTYKVVEEDKTGWINTTPKYYDEITLESNTPVTNKDFGNFKLGSIQGRKYEDLNQNNIYDTGESYLDTWTIRVYNSGWNFVKEMNTGDDNTEAGNVLQGQYRFINLPLGTYYACEVLKSGWTQTDPASSEGFLNHSGAIDEASRCRRSIVNQSGQLIQGKSFGNIQLSDIHGFKWNDLNGDGERQVCQTTDRVLLQDFETPCVDENLLSGWEIFIDENGDFQWDEGEPKTTTSSDPDPNHFGWYWFENLPPGEYQICEILQSGWNQTYPSPSCHTVSLPYNSEELRESVLNSVSKPAPAYNFGNQENPLLSLTKSNDATGDKLPGDSVTFTLTVKALGGNLKNVILTDLFPTGFSYRSGSWTSSKLGVPEPVYHSPGKWNLGDMSPEQEVTLTYIADIDSNIDPGKYQDLAWAQGDNSVGLAVYANEDSGKFVGTEVNVTKDTQSGTSIDIENKETVEGQVLGDSTSILPATGINSIWLIIALLFISSGLPLLALGTMINRRQYV